MLPGMTSGTWGGGFNPGDFMRDFMGGYTHVYEEPITASDLPSEGGPVVGPDQADEPCCEPLSILLADAVVIDLCPNAKPCRAHPEPARPIGAAT